MVRRYQGIYCLKLTDAGNIYDNSKIIMPTAIPFAALGAGNGFSFCPLKVNVADYDYWTTLSGVNKNNPETSDSLIAESLQLAMQLFWNFNGLSMEDSFTTPDGSYSDTWSVDMEAGVDEFEVMYFIKSDFAGSDSNENKTPRERVCYKIFGVYQEYGFAFFTVNIVRMYNGVTTDEGNFVGYGLGENFIGSLSAQLTLTSYMNGEGSYEDEIFDYITIDGLSLVVNAIPSGDLTSPVSITSGESSVAAYFNYTNINGESYNQTIEISDLDFYDY